MASLAPALRKKLEDAVKEARDVAEAGARAALEQLAVHAAEPFAHLSPEDRELRNRLRARARQLGDGRDTRTGAHQIDHLVVECAYEHWHRMLFARFLAENGVLMANSEALGIENTPVTLEECEELAADEGAANGWELAGRYASKMLPQIFRPDAPVLAVHLPPERQRRLEQILAELAPATFKASDALGWVYQFWQAKVKDEVNASGVKIGADELPAVTQLFTEPYMVDFLLHNTLGAWWAGKVLAERPELARTATSEEELREACALPGCGWEYLRFVRGADGWRLAAGSFEGWPQSATHLKVLDPCCGSGHFLVAAHRLLVRIRMAEEGIDERDASDRVLHENLYGLELDERCTQLAAFALALSSWTDGAGGHRRLPDLHIACSGIAPRSTESEWADLVGDDERLRSGMRWLHSLFSDAPILGSLIDPTTTQPSPLLVAGLNDLSPALERAMAAESRRTPDQSERQVAAHGLAKAASLLSDRYHLVATNVPYLLRRKQHPRLLAHLKKHHPDAVNDLAIAFAERLGRLLVPSGCTALVLPQSFIEIRSYASLRRRSMAESTWSIVARVGSGAFRTISGEVVNVCMPVIRNRYPVSASEIAAVDVNDASGVEGKEAGLRSSTVQTVRQDEIRSSPESRFSLLRTGQQSRLGEYATASWGISPADLPRFGRCFWEVSAIEGPWRRWQSSFNSPAPYSGRHLVLNMGPDLHAAVAAGKALIRGQEHWGKPSVVATVMGDIPCTIGTGEPVDTNAATIVPKQPEHLVPLWAYCESGEFSENVRKLYGGLKVTSGTLPQVPFDLTRWSRVAQEKYPNGLPKPSSSDPTQWVYDGSLSVSEAPLQVGIAALLGYRWPEQLYDCAAEHIDDDGIVCLPSIRGEEPAGARLLAVLSAGFGDDWNTKRRDALLTAVGAKGKGLDWWLQNKFFEQHCQLFQHRPFIWHIWDGIKKDGFGALVNYHKLDRKLLETLTYTYLGDWIRRQQDDAARNVDGASERLDAARRLQQNLELILEGEKPHDIFVRWKPLREQPIGWEPDLNDGVRVNIRPFMNVPDVDKKGAGVLRSKPNIHWKKDRGTDPDDAPWFELGPSYGEPKGARINDHHLSLAEKRAARERAGGR